MKLRMSLWLCLCLVMSLFTPQGVANQTTVSYASEAAYVKTEGADLNMRSEPKKAGSVLVKIPNGSTITYVEDAGTADGHNWVKITYNGKEGYAAAEYVIKGTAPTDDTCGRADDSTDGSSTTDDGYRVSYAGQL